MKRSVLGLMLLLGASGCATAHTAERAQNAVISGGYQAALELCIDAAKKGLDAGVPPEKVQSAYNDCADDADKHFGKTP